MHHSDIIAECLSMRHTIMRGWQGAHRRACHTCIYLYILFTCIYIYMSGSMAVSDSLRSSWKHTPWTATRTVQSASQISSSILQVLVIESHWTDKAHNHGPARCSHPSNWSRGEAPGTIWLYMVNRRCVLFIHYVWNVMCCLHTTVPGCYFALTSCPSTINHSLYLSGTIDHRGTCGETPHALLRVLFTLYLVLSYSIVYAACSNIQL